MRINFLFILSALLTMPLFAYGESLNVPSSVFNDAFGDRQGAFVIIDCDADNFSGFNIEQSSETLPPCSTFKIWNTLIGLETGLLTSSDQNFYEWDGEERAFSEWNKDLTLGEAFRVSCVPAFQNLAMRIGMDEMRTWIDKIEYGDQDLSAGLDVFWLPSKNRKTILISPMEQAKLLCKLNAGKLSFSEQSIKILKDIMMVKTTDTGVLYGKTGSGADETGMYTLGWFVGFVESNGKTYSFACAIKGKNVMGKDARAIVEMILEKQGLL